jgi:hypothetical protein
MTPHKKNLKWALINHNVIAIILRHHGWCHGCTVDGRSSRRAPGDSGEIIICATWFSRLAGRPGASERVRDERSTKNCLGLLPTSALRARVPLVGKCTGSTQCTTAGPLLLLRTPFSRQERTCVRVCCSVLHQRGRRT